jgi:hypothetical protein
MLVEYSFLQKQRYEEVRMHRGRERLWMYLCIVQAIIGWHTYLSLLMQAMHFLSGVVH